MWGGLLALGALVGTMFVNGATQKEDQAPQLIPMSVPEKKEHVVKVEEPVKATKASTKKSKAEKVVEVAPVKTAKKQQPITSAKVAAEPVTPKAVEVKVVAKSEPVVVAQAVEAVIEEAKEPK